MNNHKPFNIEEELCRIWVEEFCKETDLLIMNAINKNRFFEELQAYIIVAGGSNIPIPQLKQMTLDHVVEMLWSNNINLVVKNLRLKDNQ